MMSFLERVAQKDVSDNYSYGYQRFSILGAVIISVFVILVNLFLELSVEKRDEALFLQGQLYESQSNVKNIKKALESYNSIIANYPSSKVWEDANKRIIYLNRFYLKGR